MMKGATGDSFFFFLLDRKPKKPFDRFAPDNYVHQFSSVSDAHAPDGSRAMLIARARVRRPDPLL